MTSTPSDDDLDDLIGQITVDAYGDEGYWSFLQAITDDVRFPVSASLVGEPIEVTGIDFDGDERRGLLASVKRGESRAAVSVLDLDLTGADPTLARVIAAYRRWLGIS
jgi:hypothetical protein